MTDPDATGRAASAGGQSPLLSTVLAGSGKLIPFQARPADAPPMMLVAMGYEEAGNWPVGTLYTPDISPSTGQGIEFALMNVGRALMFGMERTEHPPVAGSISVNPDYFLVQFLALLARAEGGLGRFEGHSVAMDRRVRARALIEDLARWCQLQRVARSGKENAELEVPQHVCDQAIELAGLGRKLRGYWSELEAGGSVQGGDRVVSTDPVVVARAMLPAVRRWKRAVVAFTTKCDEGRRIRTAPDAVAFSEATHDFEQLCLKTYCLQLAVCGTGGARVGRGGVDASLLSALERAHRLIIDPTDLDATQVQRFPSTRRPKRVGGRFHSGTILAAGLLVEVEAIEEALLLVCGEEREQHEGDPESRNRSRTKRVAKRSGRGRPRSSELEADRQVWEAWAFGAFRTYKDLARELKVDERDARRAVDRHRKRLKKRE